MKAASNAVGMIVLFILVTLSAGAQNKLESTGNAGVGTTSPSTKFHVLGYEGSNWLTTFDNNGTSGHKAYFGYNDGSSTTYGLYITGGRNVSSQYDFVVDSKFYVMGNGHIGIGTSAPTFALGGSSSGLHIKSTSGAYATLNLQRYSNSQGSIIDFSDASNALQYRVGTNFAGGGNRLLFGYGTTPSIGMSMDSVGKVGIGAVSDGAGLLVNSGNSNSLSTGAGFIQVGGTGGNNIVFDYNSIQSRNNGSANTLAINANGGSVSIGEPPTGGSAKLFVNGNIASKKMIVTQLIWSDYVFAKDYKLRSLSSVEAFIKKNKHLPEVPSAKEVEEKGISVGDNQALLLKKIEELTLYVIQQQKEIEKLKKHLSRK